MAPTDSRNDRPLSEADIHAYADGLLASDRVAPLHRYLGAQPGEARRIAFYARLNDQIKHAFRHHGEPMAPDAASAWASRIPSLRRRLARFRDLAAVRAALSLVVALVAASGWVAATQVSPQALDNAAVMALAQAAGPSPESAAPPPPTAGTDPAPDLGAVGMRLVANRLVQLGPFSRATESVYLNGDGQPVVLMSARTLTASAEPQWTARRVGAIRLLTWTVRHERFVLAGDAATRGLMRSADALTPRR